MGTRLYPATQNTRNLELLVGAAAGTHEKIEAAHKLFNAAKYPDDMEAYDVLQKTLDELGEEAKDLDQLMMYGWGKFDGRAMDWDEYILTDEQLAINTSRAREVYDRLGKELFNHLTEGLAAF